MMLSLLALAQAMVAPAPPPPADWSTRPLLFLNPGPGMTPADTRAVMALVQRRLACRASVGPMPDPEGTPYTHMRGMRVDLLLLVAPDGRFLDILAAPGPCDPVRNFTRAAVSQRYRRRARPPEGPDPAWYRASVLYSWER
jgi:hypothetical protein